MKIKYGHSQAVPSTAHKQAFHMAALYLSTGFRGGNHCIQVTKF